MADRRGAPHRPRRDLPGRGVHPPAMMRTLGWSASTSPTPTSPGATRKWELEEYLRELARRDRGLDAAELLRQHAGHPARSSSTAARRRSRSAPCSRRRCRRPGASTPATSCSSTSRSARAARSTSTRRSTSTGRATGVVRAEPEGRLAGAVPHPAQRDPPRSPGAAVAAQPHVPSHRRTTTSSATPSRGGARRRDVVIVVVNLDPHGTRETTCTSTCPPSAWTGTTFSVHDEITGRPGPGASTTTCASTRLRAGTHPDRLSAAR